MTAERIATGVVCLLVAGGLAGGFALVGSPQQERATAFDERRVDDLRLIVEAIDARYASERRGMTLPAALPRDLRVRRPDGTDATHDPETGRAYRYARDDAWSYRLCAAFATADDDGARASVGAHPAGRACYRVGLGQNQGR